ncbi:sensor domain-containing diguanylate cyclase [Nocardioides sp.]|uniref:sensor domain-containing diguanylate cyclase n=1 Tax=Nocardioides sp. TaxID=35761 RepID=UPI00261FD311|nr:sensor domain-containing diguanylate cyclase [Nocardioides sp.]
MRRGALTTVDGAPPAWMGAVRLAAGLVVLLTALAVLVGWGIGSTALTSFGGFHDLRPWDAVAFAVAGAALLAPGEPFASRSPAAARLLVLLGVLGLLGLAQVVSHRALGVAHLVGQHPHHDLRLYPSPQVSVEMVLFSLTQVRGHRRALSLLRGIAQGTFLVIALTFGVGLTFGADELLRYNDRPGISVPAVIALLGLALGLIAIRSRSLPLRWLWERSVTGTLVRRLLPAMALLPVALGTLIVAGHRAGWFDVEFGLAMFTVVITSAGVAMVGFTAAVVRRAELRAERSASRSRALLDSAPDVTIVVDQAGTILYANAHTTTLLGYLADELPGQSVDVLVPDAVRARHVALRSTYAAQPTRRTMGADLSLTARHRDGHEIPVEISLGPVPTRSGTDFVVAIRDATQKRASEIALREAQDRYRILAEQDDLTGLSNRRRFEADIERHLSLPGRPTGALIFIDLDHFKHVNDTLGHRAGDRLLVMVSHAMAEALPEHGSIARRGGDEFLVLLREGDGRAAERHARRLVATVPQVAAEFSVGASISASAGVAAFDALPVGTHSVEQAVTTAMNRADIALYAAKGAGRNQTRLWTAADERDLEQPPR